MSTFENQKLKEARELNERLDDAGKATKTALERSREILANHGSYFDLFALPTSATSSEIATAYNNFIDTYSKDKVMPLYTSAEHVDIETFFQKLTAVQKVLTDD